jgi:hypothetical protein
LIPGLFLVYEFNNRFETFWVILGDISKDLPIKLDIFLFQGFDESSERVQV